MRDVTGVGCRSDSLMRLTPCSSTGHNHLDRLVTNRYSPTTSVGLFLAMCDPELGALDWTYTGVHASRLASKDA